MKIDYESYTMWIETEDAGRHFNGQWVDGEPQEQVLKEWEEELEEAKASDDKLLNAELRWHGDYYEDDGGITSTRMVVIAYWNWEMIE